MARRSKSSVTQAVPATRSQPQQASGSNTPDDNLGGEDFDFAPAEEDGASEGNDDLASRSQTRGSRKSGKAADIALLYKVVESQSADGKKIFHKRCTFCG
jgi:hypothetical protein